MLIKIMCKTMLIMMPAYAASAQNIQTKYFARQVLTPRMNSSEDGAGTRKYGSCGGYGVGFRIDGTTVGSHVSSIVGNVADRGGSLSIARTSAAAPLCEDTAPPSGYPRVMACEIAPNGDVSAYYGITQANALQTIKNAKTTTYVAGICE